MMKAYPIRAVSLEKAKEMQFRLVDIIHRSFNGYEFLQGGDYGVVPGTGCPRYTRKAEEVLAQFFNADAAVLVRGAGTGAVRSVMNAVLKPGQEIIVHKAPIYPTTEVIADSMGLKPVFVDFNNLDEINEKELSKIDFALLQHSRQKLDDSYELGEVIGRLKGINKNMRILVDDNYAVMKVEKIGTELGADISAFSLFKLLGPEGIGCVVGEQAVIEKIRRLNYSGGSQVQGPEAMEAIRALVYAPVALAIQAEEGGKIVERLEAGEVQGIDTAFIANAQSRVILVKFKEPVADKVLAEAAKLGAAPYPVGAESRYEVTAMFYRVSGTFLKSDPELQKYMIRINPMRAGADTVIRVLKEAVEKAFREGRS